jgi:hypothetical protein
MIAGWKVLPGDRLGQIVKRQIIRLTSVRYPFQPGSPPGSQKLLIFLSEYLDSSGISNDNSGL